MNRSQSNFNLTDLNNTEHYQSVTSKSKGASLDSPPPLPVKKPPSHQSSVVLYRYGEEGVTFGKRRFEPTPPQTTNSKNPDLLKREALDKNQNMNVRQNDDHAAENRNSSYSICYWFSLIIMYLLICIAMAILVLHVFRPRALIGIGISFEHNTTPEMTKMSDYTMNQMKILEVLRVVEILQNKMCFVRKLYKNDMYTKTCDDFITFSIFLDLACLNNFTCTIENNL
ncbi:unnamed protein product [Ceutorhynchus assimilis]|uniref:Uncharacterized protein n=1 Tax=Ceutorhynchus assimilis TaxID=467358 RepID=A0A9N9MVC2_9CUCU|nr:unnamed protein product [Ceutorhynchus assimilis]